VTLRDQSLTSLRGIAQNFGVADVFKLDKLHLVQEIELKQAALQPKPEIVIPRPEYDARLMTKTPARTSDRAIIEELLAPYVSRGLRLEFDNESWFMHLGKKNDSGTLRAPARVILRCAERLFE